MEAVGGSPRGRADSCWHSTETDLLAKLGFPKVLSSSLTLYLSIYHAVPGCLTLLPDGHPDLFPPINPDKQAGHTLHLGFPWKKQGSCQVGLRTQLLLGPWGHALLQ